jgi:hypothetical protein
MGNVVRGNCNLDRRKFLGGIASTGTLAGMSGISSAAQSREASGLLDLEDGQLKMNVRDERGKVVSKNAAIDGVDEN